MVRPEAAETVQRGVAEIGMRWAAVSSERVTVLQEVVPRS